MHTLAMRFQVLPTLLLAFAVTPCAFAAHPLLTEDTATQGLGRFQLEVQGESWRDRAAGERSRGLQSAAILSIGLQDALDLQIGAAALRERRDTASGSTLRKGALDATLDLKWRFFEREALSLGLRPGLTLPTGRKTPGLGNARMGFGALLILSYQPGPLAFHSHLGYKRNRNVHGDRKALGHVSAAASYELAKDLRLVADLSRDSNREPGARTPLRYAIAGAIWSATPDVDLDIGLKRGISGPAADNAVLLGATLRW